MTHEELFWLAIRMMMENDPDRIFYRVPELREMLESTGIEWGAGEIDSLIKKARDSERIQLHTGDVTCMTVEQARKRFTDENGFIFGTFTVAA